MSIESRTTPEIQEIVDTITVDRLPEPVQFIHTGDPQPILDAIGNPGFGAQTRRIGARMIRDVQPPQESITSRNVPINFEALVADARGQEGEKFKYVIRGANRLDIYRADKSLEQFEADGVNLLGPDMSLYLHGAHQARRIERLMEMQQVAHRRVFNAIHTTYGNTQATVDTYEAFKGTVPNFGYTDVKYGYLCGLKHDYGEARLKVDKPFNEKRDPLYNIIERAQAVAFANQIHVPTNTEDWGILQRRFYSDCKGGEAPTDEELAQVEMHLHPEEIAKALMGTEGQTHGNVERGLAFDAVELMEYVLTALRCFEACQYNRQGIQQDEYLNQEIMWLGIDSMVNHLRKLTKYAEKYVAIYDFMAHNQADIDHYLSAIVGDIELRAEGEEEVADLSFGVDPLSAYKPGRSHHNQGMNLQEAQQEFVAVADHWKQWKEKQHPVRHIWEAFIGTDHAMAAEQEDLTFLHYTARQRHKLVANAGRVAIALPIKDQFGVGLDPEVRRLHEASIYED